ncbi:ribosomal protein S18 acetylase RimI-like enzyme [Deinobacterium chartae]|uniref:Ribosomal protein S18 acetylase RimI-like enzyme n=1 Tax=Deinobacterium chartae TaxID=521158 RepID=A0A841I1F9_9DEIO|nr:GNAT family N-acetyltransferase [Deinobacterium chartae]MBB6097795.1 ribosomal protein S18 acetylase RimI-like enzyme [Deinobacterium chartae]
MSGLRRIRADDLSAVGRVAYLTGFFGSSAQGYFPQPQLFADLWVYPYLCLPDAPGFVLEERGEVIGYILGSTDAPRYTRGLLRALPRVLVGLLRGRYPGWTACLPYLLRVVRAPHPSAPASRYPAHLHLNLLEAARGRGAGRALLEAYLNQLRDRGVPGVHLSTTLENAAAVQLYRKLGFRTYLSYESPLWTPWLGRPAVHVLMTCDLGKGRV